MQLQLHVQAALHEYTLHEWAWPVLVAFTNHCITLCFGCGYEQSSVVGLVGVLDRSRAFFFLLSWCSLLELHTK